jgi:hypothetical protein
MVDVHELDAVRRARAKEAGGSLGASCAGDHRSPTTSPKRLDELKREVEQIEQDLQDAFDRTRRLR